MYPQNFVKNKKWLDDSEITPEAEAKAVIYSAQHN